MWGHTRSYSNRLSSQTGGLNGNGWLVKQWPYVVVTGTTVCVINDTIYNAVWFDLVGGAYVARFFVQSTLVEDTANKQFIYTDTQGIITKFYSYDGSIPAAKQGQFKSVTDLGGNETVATYNSTTNLLVSLVLSSGSSSCGYYYSYFTSGANSGMLQSAALQINGTNVSQAQYAYYGSSESYGSLNDLKSATIQRYIGSAWVTMGISYYRYYKAGDANGFAHGLKYVVGQTGYAQMEAAGITPETATNTQIGQYASNYFQYDATSQQAVSEQTQGTRQPFGFSQTGSSNPPGYNNWAMKTVETLPDGNENIVYTNYAGQVMLKVFESGGKQWCNYTQYDGSGRVILVASPSAVEGYSESSAGLVTLNPSSGLIKLYSYYTSTGSGAAAGYLQYEQVQEGGSGTPVKVHEYTYTSRTVGSATIYPIWKEICYPSATDQTLELLCMVYTYTWQTGSLIPAIRTTTYPAVGTDQNGSGSSDARQDAYDGYGNVTWQMDERGFITNRTFDLATGAVTELIQDVNTSLVSGAPSGWTTPAGGGLNLVSDYTVDGLGRVTQALGPAVSIDLSGTSTVLRRADWTVYQDSILQVWSGSGYATGTGPGYTYTLINPVTLTFFDQTGRPTDIIQAVRSSTSGALSAADSFPQSSWTRWTHQAYNNGSNLSYQQVYFLIPASGSGSGGTNYNQSQYSYDNMNRRIRARTPGRTITRTVYHPMGWVSETWVGTNDSGATDSDPTGGGTTGNNMVKVADYQYDGGTGAPPGDGNMTQATQYQDAWTARVTNYSYDFRDRPTVVDGEIDYCQVTTYDNLNRVIEVQRHDTTPSGNLIGQTVINFDSRNRVYQKVQYAVNPATGAVGNALTDNTWYDPSGNVIKVNRAGSSLLEKTVYDGISRAITRYKSYNTGETGYPYPVSVAGDTVFQQIEMAYDAASNVIQQTVRDRFDSATGTGALTYPGGSQPLARAAYTAYYPDAIGRVINTANYGTNGGSILSRPNTAPARSSTVLVTTVAYNSQGEAWQVTDPKGTVNRSAFDDAGRLTQLLENYVSGGTGPDQNRETDYTYNADSRVASLLAVNATTGNQVTQYIYGTTLGTSDVASNELLGTLIYPMNTVSAPDRLVLAYNRLGELKTKTDQMGTVHTLAYDLLGRLSSDSVTALGGTVDGAVLQCGYTYEVRGMVENVTHYNAASGGTVVNDVQNVYNTFGQLITQYQSHSGAVNTSMTPSVQTAYADGSANTIRPTSLTYPSGRVLNYNYGTSGGTNDLLSRIGSLIDNDGTTILAGYTYVGLDRIVVAASAQPGTELTYIKLAGEPNGDGGDPYTGWDRFSRLTDQRWITTGTGTALERTQYGYDQAGNRLWRANLVAESAGANQDEYYYYDGLYQLQNLQRGTLNGGRTGISGTLTWEENYTLDPTGNWNNYQTKLSGTWNLDQNRTHNRDNALVTLAGSSAYVAVNAVGNMTRAPQPGGWSSAYTLTWDAWNRLVKVASGSTTVAAYGYDGLSRRTVKVSGGTTRHYYYTPGWQIVEERVGSATTSDRQFVWGLRAFDDLVLRDYGSQRMYAMHDYFNCTAIVDTTGTVQERYGYNGFGQVNFMTAAFGSLSGSSYGWETLFANYRFDSETGLYQVRYRYQHPGLGRWLSRDPLYEPRFELRDLTRNTRMGNQSHRLYEAEHRLRRDRSHQSAKSGINLYGYASNRSTSLVDLLGLDDWPFGPPPTYQPGPGNPVMGPYPTRPAPPPSKHPWWQCLPCSKSLCLVTAGAGNNRCFEGCLWTCIAFIELGPEGYFKCLGDCAESCIIDSVAMALVCQLCNKP